MLQDFIQVFMSDKSSMYTGNLIVTSISDDMIVFFEIWNLFLS